MEDNLKRFLALQQNPRQIYGGDTTSGSIQSYSNEISQREQMIKDRIAQMMVKPEESYQMETPEIKKELEGFSQLAETPIAGQSGILKGKAPVTQTFGQKSQYDVFSGGVNYGVDFGVKEGTPVALPPGEWEVIDAFSGAKGKGQIGNKTNKGYGNSILVRNNKTGETMRFSHLSGVNVQPGKVYGGGTVIGASGATGNVTGAHLDLEYRNSQGQLSDVLKSPYARYLFGSGDGSSTNGKGGGNPLSVIFDRVKQNLQAYKMGRESQSNLDESLKTRLAQLGNPMADMGIATNRKGLNEDERNYLARSATNIAGGTVTENPSSLYKKAQEALKVIQSSAGADSTIMNAAYDTLKDFAVKTGSIKNKNVALTQESLKETIKRLFSGVTDDIEASKAIDNIPQIKLNDDHLISEARKYKSAEEFIKAQRNKIVILQEKAKLKITPNDIESINESGQKYKTTLSKVIDLPSLYKKYPEMKDVPITFDWQPGSAAGTDWKQIVISPTEVNFKENLLHEIQHIIQKKEGLPTGGSHSIGENFNKYLNIPGEVQARSTTSGNFYVRNYVDESQLTDIWNKAKELSKIKRK